METVNSTPYLSWEPYRKCYTDAPQPIGKYYPQWFKNLKSNLQKYQEENYIGNRTARHCAGLRGLMQIGYTIPTPYDIHSNQINKLVRMGVTPQMLHGTKWSSIDGEGNEEYVLRIVTFPWRARMSKGWRLLITDYAMDWSDDWFCFSGAPDGNLNARKQGSIGSQYVSAIPLDPNKYNYYNVEMVLAIRKGCTIPKDTVLFTAIPIYDPEYIPLDDQNAEKG